MSFRICLDGGMILLTPTIEKMIFLSSGCAIYVELLIVENALLWCHKCPKKGVMAQINRLTLFRFVSRCYKCCALIHKQLS